MKNLMYFVGGVVLGALLLLGLMWLTPSLRFDKVIDCPEPIVEVKLIDTCLTVPRITIDSSIRKAKPVIQKGLKPKVRKDSMVVTLTDTSTVLQSVKIEYYEHNDGVLRIKESIVHTGEILSFDRYIELDTPYITKIVENEIIVSPGIKKVEKFYESEIRYPKLMVGAFGQFEDFMGYGAGVGLGYQFKNGATLSFDYLLSEPTRSMVRANLYYPLIKFKSHGDKIIKPFDPSEFYKR